MTEGAASSNLIPNPIIVLIMVVVSAFCPRRGRPWATETR